ncbi:MAG: coenzyme F420-reducing hydrogenase, FrhD protein, partial [Ignavibacterium sp.]
NKEILVLGCGNILFGDDGFGPAVVKHLQKNYAIPSNVGVLNAGTSVRNLLFTLILSEKHPDKIIIVDAVDFGKEPGEILELDPSDIPRKKIDDFSMHQLPTSNLLNELKELCGVEVKIICVQVQHIPKEVSTGLTKVIKASIPKVCELIFSLLQIPVTTIP